MEYKNSIMKFLINLPVIGFSAVCVSCGSLDNMNQPISGSGFNPLDRPGMSSASSGNSEALVSSNDYGFNNGEIVEVVITNTAFYDKVPKAGEQYKRVLTVGDTLTVVGGEKEFIKVLTESGETGYVSSVMVVTKGSLTDGSDIDPNVTVVGANETPIIPDITPDPALENDVESDTAPDSIPVAPEPENVPETEPNNNPPEESAPAPELPDPKPVEPSLPEKPADEAE
jgi:hypothetical protein